MIFAALVYPVIVAFWVFIVYVLWTIAQSLKAIDVSIKQIANNLQPRS